MNCPERKRFYGKFRGTVLNNVDPLFKGRLLVEASDTGLFPSSWAEASFPFGGRQMGFWALPQIGTGVWIEFQQGDLDHPIWTGCWVGGAEELATDAKAAPPLLPNMVIQSSTLNAIVISDIPGKGGVLLKTRLGAKIEITDTGITIDNGLKASIKLIGPNIMLEAAGAISIKGTSVSINGTALVIT